MLSSECMWQAAVECKAERASTPELHGMSEQARHAPVRDTAEAPSKRAQKSCGSPRQRSILWVTLPASERPKAPRSEQHAREKVEQSVLTAYVCRYPYQGGAKHLSCTPWGLMRPPTEVQNCALHRSQSGVINSPDRNAQNSLIFRQKYWSHAIFSPL